VSNVRPNVIGDVCQIIGDILGAKDLLRSSPNDPSSLCFWDLHLPRLFFPVQPLFRRDDSNVSVVARDFWVRKMVIGSATTLVSSVGAFDSKVDEQCLLSCIEKLNDDRSFDSGCCSSVQIQLSDEAEEFAISGAVAWVKGTHARTMHKGRPLFTPAYVHAKFPACLRWLDRFHDSIDIILWQAAKWFCAAYWPRCFSLEYSRLPVGVRLPADRLLISSNGQFVAGVGGPSRYLAGGTWGSVRCPTPEGRWMLLEYEVQRKAEQCCWQQDGAPVVGISYTQLLHTGELAGCREGALEPIWVEQVCEGPLSSTAVLELCNDGQLLIRDGAQTIKPWVSASRCVGFGAGLHPRKWPITGFLFKYTSVFYKEAERVYAKRRLAAKAKGPIVRRTFIDIPSGDIWGSPRQVSSDPEVYCRSCFK